MVASGSPKKSANEPVSLEVTWLRSSRPAPRPQCCLPQLQWLAAHESDPSATATRTVSRYAVGALLHRQAAAISPHAEDMQRHVLKRDGTRRALIADEEVQAVHRATAFFAGERSESIW